MSLYYIITFVRDFQNSRILVGVGENEFKIYTTTDKDFCIEKARQLNVETNVNIQFERFRVWETDSKKGDFNKRSRCVYPSSENSLF